MRLTRRGREESGLTQRRVSRWFDLLEIPFAPSSDGEVLLVGSGIELIIETETKKPFITSVGLAVAFAEYYLDPLFPDQESQKNYLLSSRDDNRRMQHWVNAFKQQGAASD